MKFKSNVYYNNSSSLSNETLHLHDATCRDRLCIVVDYTDRDGDSVSGSLFTVVVMVKSLLLFIVIAFASVCLNFKRLSAEMKIGNKDFSDTGQLV